MLVNLKIFFLVGALGAAALTGCNDDDGTGGTAGGGGEPNLACFDYTSFDAMSPTVSFQADVLPFFQNSCGLATACHGDINQSAADRPYLGPNKNTTPTPQMIDAIFAQNVGVASVHEPAMSLIEPGEPENSFLMHKIDGTLTCDQLACASDNSCGELMPDGSTEPLAQESRDKVRRWIAQGAQNN